MSPEYNSKSEFEPGTEPPTKEAAETFPILALGDFVSIELIGGAYQGFVDTKDGFLFQDFWTDRSAYWDSALGKVVQICIGTSAEGFGGEPMSDLKHVQAYRINYVKSSLTQERIDHASFLLKPENAENQVQGLRTKASQLHQSVKDLIEERRGLIDGAMIARILKSTIDRGFILMPPQQS